MKKLVKQSKEIEKGQLSRLKLTAIFLLIICFCAIIWHFFPEIFSEKFWGLEEISQDLEELPPLNPLMIATFFGSVSGGCFSLYYKKKDKEPKDPPPLS